MPRHPARTPCSCQEPFFGHGEFLELVLSDEVTRRETHSADLRARSAGLDPSMRFENWNDSAAVSFDRAVFDELVSLDSSSPPTTS